MLYSDFMTLSYLDYNVADIQHVISMSLSKIELLKPQLQHMYWKLELESNVIRGGGILLQRVLNPISSIKEISSQGEDERCSII